MNYESFSYLFAEEKKKAAKTNIYYAYDLIVSGLHSLVEGNAVWLAEYDKIEGWLKDNHGRGLLVCGSAGVGKSLICRDIIPIVLREDMQECAVMTAYELASKGVWPKDVPYIMIDDIGVEEKHSEYGVKRDVFKELVDYAEINKINLILTTNLSLDDLAKRYGDRTIDRLANIVSVVQIDGASLRNGNTDGRGIPERHRAYGFDFDTEEAADEFAEKQQWLKNRYDASELDVFEEDRKDFNKRMPMVEKDGVLYSMLKENDRQRAN